MNLNRNSWRRWARQALKVGIKMHALSSTPVLIQKLADLSLDSSSLENDINDLPQALIHHARELTNKLYQEMEKELLREIHDKISIPVVNRPSDIIRDYDFDTPLSTMDSKVRFWTTAEARDRCLRIVAKIGGPNEKRRASALFQIPHADAYACAAEGAESPSKLLSLAEAEEAYWQDSRHPKNFIPLLPIRILPSSVPHSLASLDGGRLEFENDLTNLPADLRAELSRSPPLKAKSTFWLQLYQVCSEILLQENPVPPRSDSHVSFNPLPARRTTSKPRLTTHTAQTMYWGATLGWTVLTANRSSVKALLGEMKGARTDGRVGVDHGICQEGSCVQKQNEGYAAIWIVGPRSLSEGMSSLSSDHK